MFTNRTPAYSNKLAKEGAGAHCSTARSVSSSEVAAVFVVFEVGALVGKAVGAAVGALVGAAVVGAPVVGAAVGAAVGVAVGVLVGAAVGTHDHEVPREP